MVGKSKYLFLGLTLSFAYALKIAFTVGNFSLNLLSRNFIYFVNTNLDTNSNAVLMNNLSNVLV